MIVSMLIGLFNVAFGALGWVKMNFPYAPPKPTPNKLLAFQPLHASIFSY